MHAPFRVKVLASCPSRPDCVCVSICASCSSFSFSSVSVPECGSDYGFDYVPGQQAFGILICYMNMKVAKDKYLNLSSLSFKTTTTNDAGNVR